MTSHHDYAFPNTIDESVPNQPSITIGGLTKREYFAALAMQGILANDSTPKDVTFQEVCYRAAMQADALIEELNK
jgi:hypothetical protein